MLHFRAAHRGTMTRRTAICDRPVLHVHCRCPGVFEAQVAHDREYVALYRTECAYGDQARFRAAANTQSRYEARAACTSGIRQPRKVLFHDSKAYLHNSYLRLY